MGETEPRVLGLPRRWWPTRRPTARPWVRHPLVWVGWRRQVRRLGPYACSWPEHLARADRTDDGVE